MSTSQHEPELGPDEAEQEAWLRRFQPRGPRPELRDAILAAAESRPEARGRRPWLALGLLIAFGSALLLDVRVGRACREELRTGAPPELSRGERETGFLRSQGVEAAAVPWSRSVLDSALLR